MEDIHLDNNFLFQERSYTEKYRKRVRCDECEYSEKQTEYDPKYLKCNRHFNTLCEGWQTCKAAKLKKVGKINDN